jgi:hypothetical protein
LKRRNVLLSLAAAAAALATSAFLPAPARADVEDRLYDFTDAFYLRNGINPAALVGRRQANPPLAVADRPMFSYQRPVRALLTLPAYNHSGGEEYFTVLAGFSAAAFTNNAAGARARQIADAAPEYVFPVRGANR